MSPPPTTPSRQTRSADCGFAGGAVVPLVPGPGRRTAKARPLPDAAAVRMLRVPECAPPYDDDLAGIVPGERRAPRPPGPGEPPRLTGAAEPAGPARDAKPPGPLRPPRSPRPPDPAAPATARGGPANNGWPSQFAQVLAETLAGCRPRGQITPWTSDQARRRLRQLGPVLAAGVQPRVRRIVTSRPTADVVEMTVIVGVGPAIRALAVRLERGQPRHAGPGAAQAAGWICTAIEAA